MATGLKRTGITGYALNFSDMLFMIIEMASPRGFYGFILKAEKYAKKVRVKKYKNPFGNALSIPPSHNSKSF